MTRYLMAVICTLFGYCIDASASSLTSKTWINNADEITEEWLVDAGAESGYTEHIRHFKILFNSMSVRTFLEFGVGFSTKYFIDNSENVVSVEFITPGSGPEWLQYCINLYTACPTWKPIAYFSGNGLNTSWATYKYMGKESVYKACAYQPVYYKSYALIDPSFLSDLNNFINMQVAANPVDVAFIDAGVCIRGDLVQSLFNKVPIIAAHDIAPIAIRKLNDVYGYGRVVVPSNYVEIYVPFGMGTAFWVLNIDAYQEIIISLQEYANGVEP